MYEDVSHHCSICKDVPEAERLRVSAFIFGATKALWDEDHSFHEEACKTADPLTLHLALNMYALAVDNLLTLGQYVYGGEGNAYKTLGTLQAKYAEAALNAS